MTLQRATLVAVIVGMLVGSSDAMVGSSQPEAAVGSMAFVGWSGVAEAEPAEAGRCIGVKPIKPIKPIGCKDLVIMCTCDSRGNKCDWEWVCVGR